MGKKRQPDFQKTQMKPGRTVAKRKNITSVSFKSKKIIMPNKGSKQNVQAKTIPDCLKVIKGSSSVAAKTSAIDDLNKLIINHRSSLFSYLAEVLEAVCKLFLDADSNLRNAVASVLESILLLATDVQIQSFVPLFVNTLSVAMTHTNMKIKEHSLTLLTPMMTHHPDLISHSAILLDNLINMLIGSPRTRTHSQVSKQNLSVMYSESIYSPHWRMKLLGHIDIFLKAILKNRSLMTNKDHEEDEVYWDSKDPLYLPIYAGSGVKPFDIETSYSNHNASQETCDDANILVLLNNILEIVPSLYIELTASLFKNDEPLLDGFTIRSLNILFEVVTTISDCLKVIPSDDMIDKIKSFMKVNIYEKKRFPFKRKGASSGKREEDFYCMQLNLNVCYLYCTYLLEVVENKHDFCGSIFSYLKTLFKVSEILKRDSIPVLVKITEFFLDMREAASEEFLTDFLFQLSSLLKISDSHPNKQLLTSLFSKICLESGYFLVTESDGMKEWYRWLLNNLREIPKTGKVVKNVDKEILKVIKKIANRRDPCFHQLLMQIDFSVITALLKYDDDDVRDAAIFLIYNMKDITTNLLDDIARMISESFFPKKFAVRLIRLMTYRFSEKPLNGKIPDVSIYNSKGLIDIVKFFLNIAIDSFNMNKKNFIDYGANEYTAAVKIIRDAFAYSILPSTHWEEHSDIFEACARFLNQLPSTVVKSVTVRLFQEVLDNVSILPMHVVISMLKLNSRKMKDYYGIQIHDLIFGGLLTTSILTCMSMDDKWYECNVTELIDSMDLNSAMALEMLKNLEFLKDDEIEGIVAYHILRVCKFLIEGGFLKQKHYERVLKTMDTLKDKCSDKTIEQQPLFISLCNHLTLYMD